MIQQNYEEKHEVDLEDLQEEKEQENMDEGNKVSSVCTKASNEDQDRQMKIAFEHMTSDVIIRPPNF